MCSKKMRECSAEEFHLGGVKRDAGLVGIFDEVLVPRLVAVSTMVLLSAFFSAMRAH